MSNAWKALTDWESVCARAAGRRRYNAVRQVRARLRRRTVLQHIRREGLHWGVQAELARRLGVSRATISGDLQKILATPGGYPAHRQQKRARHPATASQHAIPHQGKEAIMSTRITLRLPSPVKAQLAAMAKRESVDLSTLVRRLVRRVLDEGQGAGDSTPLPPVSPATAAHHEIHHCMDTIFTALPLTMQAELRERASQLGLHVSSLLWQRLHAIALTPDGTRASALAAPSDKREDTAHPAPQHDHHQASRGR